MTCEPNAARAYEVWDVILKHEHALLMDYWASRRLSPQEAADSGVSFADSSHYPERVTLEDLTSGSSCGTAACLAGWTAVLDGWSIRGNRAFKNGAAHLVKEVAAMLLGVDEYDADALFFAGGDTADVYARIQFFFGPDPRPQQQ